MQRRKASGDLDMVKAAIQIVTMPIVIVFVVLTIIAYGALCLSALVAMTLLDGLSGE